jgi:hypothetical protein
MGTKYDCTFMASQNIVSNAPYRIFKSTFNTVNNQITLFHRSAAAIFINTVTYKPADRQ